MAPGPCLLPPAADLIDAPPSRKILKPTPNCERAALRLQAAERAYGAGRVPSSAQVCGYAEALIISGRYEQCLEVCRRVASPDAATAYLRAESEWRLGDLSGAVATVAPHARDERCRELMQFVQFLHSHHQAAEKLLEGDHGSSAALKHLNAILRAVDGSQSHLQAQCLMKRARVLLASSDAAGALSDATAVVDVVAGQSPETAAGALALRSEAHMQLRDYESAFNDLRRAAALSPSMAGSLVKRMREAASAALGSSKGRRPPSDTGSAASASSGGEGSQRGAAAGEERSGRAAAALPRFYRILGVGLDATEADISRGYRKMAAKWHPDKWVGSGEDRVEVATHRFHLVNEAYETLRDPQRRGQYDARFASS